jgi:hypothetical protein
MLFNTLNLYDGAVTADTDSNTIEMLQMTSLSVQIVATGTTVTYDFTLYESNDGIKYKATSTTAALSATSGEQILFLKLTDAPSRFYKVFIDKTTNNLTSCVITAHAKGV